MNSDKRSPEPGWSRRTKALCALVLLALLTLALKVERDGKSLSAQSTPNGSGIVQKQPQDERPSHSHGDWTVDVCGHGLINLNAKRSSDIETLESRQVAEQGILDGITADASERWEVALLSSPDARVRAVGLLREIAILRTSHEASPEAPLHELSLLARRTRDPVVYGLTAQLCTNSPNFRSSDSCAGITIKDWSELDGDNAVPWLLLAQQSAAVSDHSAEESELTRASLAHAIDSYGTSQLIYGSSVLPRDLPPLENYYLARSLLEQEDSWPMRHYGAVAKLCSVDSVLDASRSEKCGAIADILLANGKRLTDLYVAAMIGDHVGWPEARTASIRSDLQLLSKSLPLIGEFWDCRNAQILSEYVAIRARLGELDAARDASVRQIREKQDQIFSAIK